MSYKYSIAEQKFRDRKSGSRQIFHRCVIIKSRIVISVFDFYLVSRDEIVSVIVLDWGVIATEELLPGSFLLEYRGKLIDKELDGEYVYEFTHKGKNLW